MKEHYYIRVKNELVEVEHNIYKVYYTLGAHEAYCIRRSKLRELPLMDEICAVSYNLENQVIHNFELSCLRKALRSLTKDELYIIGELFYFEKTQSNVALKLGVTQQEVSRRKRKILKKLKSIIAAEFI